MEIKRLIYWSENKFIIAIDKQYDIDWETKDEFEKLIETNKKKDEIGNILNQVAMLESKPIKGWPKNTLLSVKRIIGEAIARAYNFDFINASKIIHHAESFIKEKSPEVSRYWTLLSSSLFTLIIIITSFFYHHFEFEVGNIIDKLIYSSTLGGLGAYFFVLIRLGKLSLDSESGKLLHFTNGVSRILIGCFSGFFINLVIISEIALSPFKDNVLALYTFSFISGFSETLVPNIIAKIENKSKKKMKDKKYDK